MRTITYNSFSLLVFFYNYGTNLILVLTTVKLTYSHYESLTQNIAWASAVSAKITMATELNGTALARRISTSSLEWYPRRKSKPVIAIDFGTSTLAVAYGIPNEKGKMEINCIGEPDWTLLLTSRRTGTIVATTGKMALQKYGNNKSKDEMNELIFFEKVKLELQHNQVISYNNNYYYN